jgi:carbonic anhydrase/acetyltransferase-like protein (isoleucine patch superfamily)
MLIEHNGRSPRVDPSAVVAPTAVLSGEVRIGPGSRVLHGAVVTAEDGAVDIGANVVIMEHALVRGRAQHPARIGDHVMVGPHAHVNGAQIEDEAFIATGAAIFPGAVIGRGAEVRVHGVVQVNTVLPPGAIVPIGWVAVGREALILPPDRHDEIWAIQSELEFGAAVYGVPSGTPMPAIMRGQSEYYGSHASDHVL